MKKYFSILLILCLTLLSTGCGYKPTAYYAKSAINGLVYVDLGIDIDNSSDSIIVKDTVNMLVLNQFGKHLANSKSEATSFIYVKLNKISYSAISSDSIGFTNRYRATVTIQFTYNKKDKSKKSFTVSNFDDYYVNDNSSTTDANKHYAIENATKKALEDTFSKIAITNLSKNNNAK